MRNLVSQIRKPGWVRLMAGLLLVVLPIAVVAFITWKCTNKDTGSPLRLVVYAFSTQEELFTQSIFPAFEESWETQTGRKIKVQGVFGGSGTLAGQINLGAPADLAVFSNDRNVIWLRIGKMLNPATQSHVIGYSPLVIVTRPGNPLGIREYADLAQLDLDLIHADPRSSGMGEWSLLAEYGSVYLEAGDQDLSEHSVQSIWRNVRVLAPSARAAFTLFELGTGDAFVTYEQDALLALQRGIAMELVMPARTIVAEPVVVMIDKNLTLSERPAAEAFIEYLIDVQGQQRLAQYYLRPLSMVSESATDLVELFTVEDLGGWSQAYELVIEQLWRDEIEPGLDLAYDLDFIERDDGQ